MNEGTSNRGGLPLRSKVSIYCFKRVYTRKCNLEPEVHYVRRKEDDSQDWKFLIIGPLI